MAAPTLEAPVFVSADPFLAPARSDWKADGLNSGTPRQEAEIVPTSAGERVVPRASSHAVGRDTDGRYRGGPRAIEPGKWHDLVWELQNASDWN